MHIIFTIGILTIADFESMMKKGGSYCLILVCEYNKDKDLQTLEAYCHNYPTVKCYYGLEGAKDRGQPDTSFNTHFQNKGTPAFFFFKNGNQAIAIVHDSTKAPYKAHDVDAAFKSVQ
ncbi:uncharacterized protein LOC111055307 [Nilaparvata lugens]|uniref:uncharacterized protein LOC111055307 n=1 Tax=Nilaparvata lugens TaxID=108931 RepID=UPI00193EA249|nr:uncharacterized protein LOC111055307 [Nilaparvata lugens]